MVKVREGVKERKRWREGRRRRLYHNSVQLLFAYSIKGCISQ
jgi:hypothetical protein